MVTYIEGTAHGACVTFLTQINAIFFFLFFFFRSGNGQVTFIQVNLYVFFFEAGQIHNHFIFVFCSSYICQHDIFCVFAVQRIHFCEKFSVERGIGPVFVVKQVISKKVMHHHHKSYLPS